VPDANILYVCGGPADDLPATSHWFQTSIEPAIAGKGFSAQDGNWRVTGHLSASGYIGTLALPSGESVNWYASLAQTVTERLSTGLFTSEHAGERTGVVVADDGRQGTWQFAGEFAVVTPLLGASTQRRAFWVDIAKRSGTTSLVVARFRSPAK
jgi:hypothetical protein